MNDPRWARRYTQNDAPRLREIRKRLDGEPPMGEVDIMVYDLLEEVVPLASDYIGNTIVQKVRRYPPSFSFPGGEGTHAPSHTALRAVLDGRSQVNARTYRSSSRSHRVRPLPWLLSRSLTDLDSSP